MNISNIGFIRVFVLYLMYQQERRVSTPKQRLEVQQIRPAEYLIPHFKVYIIEYLLNILINHQQKQALCRIKIYESESKQLSFNESQQEKFAFFETDANFLRYSDRKTIGIKSKLRNKRRVGTEQSEQWQLSRRQYQMENQIDKNDPYFMERLDFSAINPKEEENYYSSQLSNLKHKNNETKRFFLYDNQENSHNIKKVVEKTSKLVQTDPVKRPKNSIGVQVQTKKKLKIVPSTRTNELKEIQTKYLMNIIQNLLSRIKYFVFSSIKVQILQRNWLNRLKRDMNTLKMQFQKDKRNMSDQLSEQIEELNDELTLKNVQYDQLKTKYYQLLAIQNVKNDKNSQSSKQNSQQDNQQRQRKIKLETKNNSTLKSITVTYIQDQFLSNFSFEKQKLIINQANSNTLNIDLSHRQQLSPTCQMQCEESPEQSSSSLH